MAESSLQFSLNFFNKKPLKICEGIAACFTDNRDQAKVKHPLNQLISQRVYQITAGYEDANDSNYLRQDPIFKLACNQVPIPGENLLASQPTMSRLENQVTPQDIKEIRRFFLDRFLESYSQQPSDAWSENCPARRCWFLLT